MSTVSNLWIGQGFDAPSDPDIKWGYITAEANRLKTMCDWTQLLYSGLSLPKRLEYEAYRETLDSLRDDFINPDDVVFPVPPVEA